MLDAGRGAVYRIVLLLAGAYNVALGLWSVLLPEAFFELFGLVPPNHPAIWRCLGMVLGLYGLLYAWAGFHLERARPIVLVGLLGKVLGPVGWLLTVGQGEWPLRTVTLIFLDDLVWWLPFTLFLLEGTRLRERLSPLAPYACALVNAAASGFLALVLRPGTEVEPDPLARARFIAAHPGLWRTGWILWVLSASLLVAFYGWWSARAQARRLALGGVALCACGVFLDATAESLFVGWLPERMDLQRLGTALSGGGANGFYCLGGALLTLATPSLPPGLKRWAWAVWISGAGLSVAAFADHVPAMVVATALTLGLFVPFACVLGRRLG
jgi:hypothetical protein